MTKLKYHNIKSIAKAQAERIFLTGSKSEICYALLNLMFHFKDWKFVQDLCLSFLYDIDLDVKRVAIPS